jgi:hypothetical protein
VVPAFYPEWNFEMVSFMKESKKAAVHGGLVRASILAVALLASAMRLQCVAAGAIGINAASSNLVAVSTTAEPVAAGKFAPTW